MEKVISSFYRITDWFGLKETFKDHLVKLPAVSRDIFYSARLFKTSPNQTDYFPGMGYSAALQPVLLGKKILKKSLLF